MRKKMPVIFGKLLNFTPKVSELIVVKDVDDHFDTTTSEQESEKLLAKVNQGFDFLNENPTFNTILEGINQGVPMVPFPTVEDCLGLRPKDSSMVIKEGYAILAYDFDISATSNDCIYNV